MNAWIVCGSTPAELSERIDGYRTYLPFADKPADEILTELREEWGAIAGTPREVIAQLQAYAAAGVTELSVQWPGLEDLAGLEQLATEIMPLV
jgi:alkanesulfonate monooxygenase SsuD/methylene tetrahydromethanopterin reductase-like flavin-dependent oxidoreductase (luciferase family)